MRPMRLFMRSAQFFPLNGQLIFEVAFAKIKIFPTSKYTNPLYCRTEYLKNSSTFDDQNKLDRNIGDFCNHNLFHKSFDLLKGQLATLMTLLKLRTNQIKVKFQSSMRYFNPLCLCSIETIVISCIIFWVFTSTVKTRNPYIYTRSFIYRIPLQVLIICRQLSFVIRRDHEKYYIKMKNQSQDIIKKH